MKSYIKEIDGADWIVKLILALPVLDGIVYGLYRLFKGIEKNDILMIVVGLIWIFAGATILWVIDIITVLVNKKVTFLA